MPTTTEPHRPHNPAKLERIQNILYSQREIVQDTIDKTLRSFPEQTEKNRKHFISFITNPAPCPYPIKRDPELSPEIINHTENLLKSMGINPSRINLKITDKYSVIIECKKHPKKFIINNLTITIDRKSLKNDLTTLDAPITHEATHLLEADQLATFSIHILEEQLKFMAPLLKKTQELIADGIPSIRDPQIAIQNYKDFNCKKQGRSPYDDLEYLIKSDSNTHPNDSSRCQLAQDILIAHFGKMPKNL